VHWTVAISFTLLGITGLILTFGKTVLRLRYNYRFRRDGRVVEGA
jgi:cytochrome b subunit of formate dehydrogenase